MERDWTSGEPTGDRRKVVGDTLQGIFEEQSKRNVSRDEAIALCQAAAYISKKNYAGGEIVAAALKNANLDQQSASIVKINVQHGIAVAGDSSNVDQIVKQCKKDAETHLTWTNKSSNIASNRSTSSSGSTRRERPEDLSGPSGEWHKDRGWWSPGSEVA